MGKSQEISITTIKKAIVGIAILINVPVIEAASSPVDTAGLANPPVDAVEAPRTNTLDP